MYKARWAGLICRTHQLSTVTSDCQTRNSRTASGQVPDDESE